MSVKPEICIGIRDDGEPCQSPYVLDNGYCSAHQPDGRKAMRERGRKGQAALRAKMKAEEPLTPDELPPLTSFEAAEQWLAVIGEAVAIGRITDKRASAARQIVDSWLKARGEHEAAERISALESQIEAMQEEREARLRAL